MELLLIDDDEIDRTAIIRALAQSDIGFNVVEANCAQVGLDLVRLQRFDGIILDYRLPDANGLELLPQLHSTAGDATAVVMISRYEDENLADRCIEMGAQDFLLKDEVNTRRLTRAIRLAKQRASMSRELQKTHERLRNLAEHDSLTHLLNRYGFEVSLSRALAMAREQNAELALILLDLDDFKGVNDTHGHQMGDRLLVDVAARLRQVVPDDCLLARVGGDEFVVVLSGNQVLLTAEPLAAALLQTLQPVFTIDEQPLFIGACAGIASYGALASNSSGLLKCADIALYRAKQRGRNQLQLYSEALDLAVQQRQHIATGLRQALEFEQFRLFYQGKFNAHTGALEGMEALLRWQHPQDGLIAPDCFLPVAEELGMMDAICEWVLPTACRQTQQWLQQLPAHQRLTIAVNLSASQKLQDKLLQQVEMALCSSGLPAELLELEITENALIEKPRELAEVLEDVVAMGVTLSLDDFGTGFSSLEHVKDFPIKVLKIDKSFVWGIEQDERARCLLAALINFARGFNVLSVAEGIETASQAQFCRDHGCHLLQGYLYGKPMPPEQFWRQYLQPLIAGQA
ncbi:putative bifunctional diguanylate cyclase/phosphodiesterase [Shewanella dokdonensis]|uniref:putative bifunctional diguanylate cyclase/phosphodiesterase n=1 Tax=Shewanella dokdonensis TaxID=712036 RepID=UPI00200BE079|nr:GGDEF domain-containing response regulator [Shewanella dokdonensis]MCL1075871.1 GGDEF domain-containing response regulator [Shewanella dokdonensis]